jgi:predicted phage terminase large subunit-like protein
MEPVSLLRSSLLAFGIKGFTTLNPGETFVPSLAYLTIAHALDRVAKGELRRLIINVPPRSGKSLLASVCLPAYVLGKDPTQRVVCVSYSQDLASKLARDCRALMASPAYGKIFPGTITGDKNTEAELQTSARGFRLATSVGGTLTGRGGNLIILDDPMKPDEANSRTARDRVDEWFRGTLLSRLDHKDIGRIVVVMQRLHVDDLCGRLLEEGGWEHLQLRAIAEEDENHRVGGVCIARKRGEVLNPDREPIAVLQALRRDLGGTMFEAQYQQSPVPTDGALVRWSWFRPSDEALPRTYDRFVISWDTALKGGELNDFSVGIVGLLRADRSLDIVEIIRERLEYPDLRRRMIRESRRWPGSVTLVEDAGSGSALFQELRREGVSAISVRPEGDKVMRLMAVTALIEAGRVGLPSRSPWLDVFKRELLSFPHSKHDDQVDAFSQLLRWVDRGVVAFATSRSMHA